MKPELSFEGVGREHSRQRSSPCSGKRMLSEKAQGGMVPVEKQTRTRPKSGGLGMFCLHPKRLGSKIR